MTLKNLSEQNISSKVLIELREAIQSGELEPGARLVERDLASRLGVSHIPIREALTILTEERLVERQPRRGARVATLSTNDIEEITSLRIVLEQFVGRRVQERWDADASKRLRLVVAAMKKAAERGQREKMFTLDRQFHELLWELSEHHLLMDLTTKLRGRLNGFLHVANNLLEPADLIEHAQAHEEIVDAVESGEPERLQTVIAQHIRAAASRISAVANEFGD